MKHNTLTPGVQRIVDYLRDECGCDTDDSPHHIECPIDDCHALTLSVYEHESGEARWKCHTCDLGGNLTQLKAYLSGRDYREVLQEERGGGPSDTWPGPGYSGIPNWLWQSEKRRLLSPATQLVWLELALMARRKSTTVKAGTLSEGQALFAERSLAEKLGIHRSSVTRAIKTLKKMGLVRFRSSLSNRGTIADLNYCETVAS